ncbi:hypothetical protein [Streptomyces sp. NPDC059371]|uniref:hypothetical protein n=1 Tax=Streptomyces sp. NPDC059371 TaxID=3346812 RepID=UPI0036B7C8A5
MPEEMHGDRPASSEPSTRTSSSEDGASASNAQPSADTPRVLSDEAREQLTRAMEQKNMHIGRMSKKVGRPMAEDMWQKILLEFHTRLLNHGPVDRLDSYINRCVTNMLSKLRTTIEVVIGDENLELIARQAADDPQIANVFYYNHELIEAVHGIRKSDILTKREADVYVLGQILGEDNNVIAEWLDPPGTAARVATIKWRAMRKVQRAWREGKFTHLGYEPPRK